ncbi:MAG: glycoside hydrolase family 9 protein [Cyanobacteria bacterium P01_A01_bin.3]
MHLPDSVELEPKQRYSLDFVGELNTQLVDVGTFSYTPKTGISEAIHVSQIGFDPDDPKQAFLSLWMGQDVNGEAPPTPDHFSEGLQFWVVDAATGQKVEDDRVTRVATLSSPVTVDEDFRKDEQNYQATDVFTLEFSDFNRPGRYAIQVDGVGKSFEFEIAENIWERAFQVSMQGLYNQRSGTAIGGPYSQTLYPRSFHPDDGVLVFPADSVLVSGEDGGFQAKGVRLIDMALERIGPRTAFDRYTTPFDLNGDGDVVAGDLAPFLNPLANAWGGYKDAGDWDRRIQHLFGTRQHLELLELFPEYFQKIELNIPETLDSFPNQASLQAVLTENGLPDLLDESLWSLDLYRRLQTADGGVRGGIESAGHPLPGETSWQESQTVFAYAADPWASYIYAGVAARAARVLAFHDADLADQYRDSALRAINWAEAGRDGSDPVYESARVKDERNLAALELYLLTEDPRWHQLFLSTTVFRGQQCGIGQPCNEVFESKQHDRRQAAFLYARAPQHLTNVRVRQNAIDAILRAAETSLAIQNGGSISVDGEQFQSTGTAFNWTKSKNLFDPVNPGTLSTPQVDLLLQAYYVTGEQGYLDAAIQGSQFAAGANPANTAFTTGLVQAGLAQREPVNPFIIDARYSGQEAPAGITTYGPIDTHLGFGRFQVNLYSSATIPSPQQWPVAEAYFDNYWNFRNSEFTIHQTIAPTAYTWGFFAASDFETSRVGTDDLVRGTAGDDRLNGFAGDDTVVGLQGEDELRGGQGRDRLLGGTGSDLLLGEEGNDRGLGGNGDDTIKGGTGEDTLAGGLGDDRLLGGEGEDTLLGEAGADLLSGGMAADVLNGQSGADVLDGGKGSDILIGGAGNDRFQLVSNSGSDLILDFKDGVDRFGLTDGLSFDELSMQQRGKHVVIIDSKGDEIALVHKIDAAALTGVDFV